MPLQSLINRNQAVKKMFFILLSMILFLIVFFGYHYLFLTNDFIYDKTNQLIWSVLSMTGMDSNAQNIFMFKLNLPVLGIFYYGPIRESSTPLFFAYLQLLTPPLATIIVFFLSYEHYKLGFIPKEMDLKQWQTGIWRPSLILLYRANNARHKYLFYTGMFLIFPVVMASIREPDALVMAMFFMLPVVMFAPIALFRVISDYHLITKGIPVECHFVESRTEHAWGGRQKITWDIQVYQAEYKGHSYYIEGTSEGISSSSTTFVALINPYRTNGGILLNSFYK